MSVASILNSADQWRASRSAQANALWAKSGNEDAYLRLPQHLIDAACVAEWLWEHWVSRSLKATLSQLWGLEEEYVRRLYCFLAGTHDVGKATVSFQRLVKDSPRENVLLPPLYDVGLSLDWPQGEGPDRKFPHGMASALLLRQWLADRDVEKMRRVAVSSVVDAHHGFTSDAQGLANFAEAISGRQSCFDEIATEFLDSMAELTDIDEVLEEIDFGDVPVADALQLMTGLVIMADWIASNEKAFPYTPLHAQRQRLEEAIAYINLPGPWIPLDVPDDTVDLYRRIFAWSDGFQPRPVQAAVVEAAQKTQGPALMIIEAPTGEGKTEAGLAAAHVMGQRCGAQGVFLAAPTMSTANGLFERTANWARRSSRQGEVASMFLAHSKNRLVTTFESMRFSGIGEDGQGSDTGQGEGAVVATQWLCGAKTGVLSDFVVGTVDQVLMMALQARFSMLRHVGLAGKIIIIDEVHAYDTYMSQYLYRALEWLSRYGVSVILMSATLPPSQKKKLAAAYASQLIEDAENAVEVLDTEGYPLVSVVDATGVRATDVEQRPTDTEMTIHHLDDSLSELASMLTEQLDDGGVGLVICNTVARAQEAYRELAGHFPGEAELHHAAFIAASRSDKEDSLREQLGPSAHRGGLRPWRKIIVATQVAEQSLDIDADLLITDIAPIDLMIQRAGRVHRHHRPATDRPSKLQSPKIYVRGIETRIPVPRFDGGATAVYGDKLLLATLACLPDVFRRPDDAEGLVREVYSSQLTIPEEWADAWDVACADDKKKRDRAEARAKTYRFPSPTYAANLSDLFSQLHSNTETVGGEERGNAQVRDADFTIEVVAIETTEYGYSPLVGDATVLEGMEPSAHAARQLAASTVRLPARMTRREVDFDQIIDELEGQTPGEWHTSSLLRGSVALRFDAQGTATVGRFEVSYDSECGLCVLDEVPSP
ncbi:CRISPR-associated helicase Cas3' [Corynebacterium sp. 4HC-13]|uniref:CRISPR-associated helicase Cas3' n=1 Tax=Corynebacterium anserum TaxID=2684406 RepID=UPI00163A6111|nr:CRISPR-associated helicase Cas3' [Corynebacterium anserum]MBC2681400.1 CRISPR-associated helicase Cas3' [Corynebacterium anserum]